MKMKVLSTAMGCFLFSSFLALPPFFPRFVRSLPANKGMTRIDPVTVQRSGLFELAGLPATDLPAVGKGGFQPKENTYEVFVNPLKFNSGLVSPITPIRTEGGSSTSEPTGLKITDATLQFGGVKPSACKIPGLDI